MRGIALAILALVQSHDTAEYLARHHLEMFDGMAAFSSLIASVLFTAALGCIIAGV